MSDELGLFGEPVETAPAAPEPTPAPAPAPEPAPVEAVKPEEPKGEKKDASPASEKPRDEHGRFAPKRDEGEPTVPLSAYLAEREKRQTAEARTKESPQPAPDIWVDPAAFIKHELAQREPEIMQKATEAARSQFFNYTLSAAKARHATDPVPYDTVFEAFKEVAQNDPLLMSKFQSAEDPGEFIYQQGKRAMELKEVGGDLAAYTERKVTEARQKWEAEAAERAKRNANIPVSLNSEPSKGAGVQGQSGWAGPTPDEQVFPQR